MLPRCQWSVRNIFDFWVMIRLARDAKIHSLRGHGRDKGFVKEHVRAVKDKVSYFVVGMKGGGRTT